VDESNGTQLTLTLFNEGEEQIKRLKQGSTVQVAPAGVDRKPTAAPISGKVTALGKNGRQAQVTIEVDAGGDRFQPTGVLRLWVQP
jgi:hypothetical protein